VAQQLIDAIASSGVTLVVIDFEYTTPKGASPEPIEVAVQALQVRDGQLERGAAAEVLMRPPEHAALMAFDIEQTGITPEMLADVPPAGEVLAQLDRRFTSGRTSWSLTPRRRRRDCWPTTSSSARTSRTPICSTPCAWPASCTPTWTGTAWTTSSSI
jgi:ubiquitin